MPREGDAGRLKSQAPTLAEGQRQPVVRACRLAGLLKRINGGESTVHSEGVLRNIDHEAKDGMKEREDE